MNNINTYLMLIDKYFKKEKTELLVELLLENYNGRNFYFRIDYYKKDRVYKLNFIDLDHIESNNIGMWINSNNLEPTNVFHIENVLKNVNVKVNNINDSKYRVTFNSFFNKINHMTFKRYIPNELYFLAEIILIIFNNAPKKLEGYFYELIALLDNNTKEFEYNDFIKFDIYKGNIDKLFSEDDIKKGNVYYNDDCIKFLEKVNDKFYAVIDGAEEYVIIIDYDSKKKEMKLFSSCPCIYYCKHLYAVLKAIQNKEEKRFYKLIYTDNQKNNYIDNLLNLSFYLCLGVNRGLIKYISRDGNIDTSPLVGIDGKCHFKIIEDDDNESISRIISNSTLK